MGNGVGNEAEIEFRYIFCINRLGNKDVQMNTHMHAYTCRHAYTNTHMQTRIHKHTHADTHTQTHTCRHAYTNTHKQAQAETRILIDQVLTNSCP